MNSTCFGVASRLALSGRRRRAMEPHGLMMSATPIPRTLAMSYYADLDVSVIEVAVGARRLSPVINAARRGEVMGAVAHAVAQGRQAYCCLCPLIEES